MLVYIAGPYSLGDVAVNVKNAIDAAEQVWKAGHTPFVPHLTHFWHMFYPHDYESWLHYDSMWLGFCDALVRLPGESHGADIEIRVASQQHIPVYYGVEAFLNEYGRSEVSCAS